MRRVQRGMATREEFAERVNLTYRVLTDLENGARRLGPKSYRKIEETLDWPPGSCEAILIGGWSTTTIDAIDQRAAFLDTAQPRPVNHAVIDEIALAAPGPQTPLGNLFDDAESVRRAVQSLRDRMQQATSEGIVDSAIGTLLTQTLNVACGDLADVTLRLVRERMKELAALLEAKSASDGRSSDGADVDEPTTTT